MTENLAPASASTPKDPSRRRLLVMSAWAMPVVAAATVAPLAAATTGDEIELTPLNDEAAGGYFLFPEAVGDEFALLTFSVTQSGQPYVGSGAATLIGAGGIAEWDEVLSPTGADALVDIDEYGLVLPLTVLAAGSLTVLITIDGQSWTFTVEFS